MIVVGQIRKGAYFDSVTLMRVGKELAGRKGVADAAMVMGTKSNKAILNSSGLLAARFKDAGDTDLLVAVKADTQAAADAALAVVDGLLKQALKKTSVSSEVHPTSLDGALRVMPDANLALISVAGRYAGDEAMRALENGLHVMLFSDNVPLEKEIELKKFAQKSGLLVMGPDCGTAIINGIPLAFANVVNRGNIGIVAAAGTGLQEVSCIISNEGAGVSQAIGTGGRDVKKEVGGIMFLESLKALAKDQTTRVILLVSKPPHSEVLRRITKLVKTIRKPVVTLFIGAGTRGGGPSTLEEAALTAVAVAGGKKPEDVTKKLAARDAELRQIAAREAAKRKRGQKYVRGLFSGGTFCAEAQILFSRMISGVYSNAPAGKAKHLKNSLNSQKNTVIDLGEDEFTVGRPHPMIDYTLRNRRILDEAQDPATAVILLDVVLGYGSHPDPAAELSGVIRQARKKVAVVCSITGTDKDPQNRSRVEVALRKAGAIVMPSNAAACQLAGGIIQLLGRR
ncbi:MAG TPA: acyl-CoA synthetase FdrA [Verrucomicrobiae bacterium]|nr:acyl-CoA synthetase FdrA [Verrucomicrobiae bacterium]